MGQVSKRLQSAIRRKGMTLLQLEKASGVSRSAIHRYYTGATDKIPIDRLRALAKALDVEAAYLMGWEDDPNGDLQTITPSDAEKSLILAFRALTQKEKNIIVGLMQSMLKEEPQV